MMANVVAKADQRAQTDESDGYSVSEGKISIRFQFIKLLKYIYLFYTQMIMILTDQIVDIESHGEDMLKRKMIN
jgi:hypothetical protein